MENENGKFVKLRVAKNRTCKQQLSMIDGRARDVAPPVGQAIDWRTNTIKTDGLGMVTFQWPMSELKTRYSERLVREGRKERKEMFYLTTHSTHFIYGYMASDIW